MERLALHGGTPVRDGGKRWPKWPQFDETELRNVRAVFESNLWGGTSHGPMKMAAQEQFAAYHDAKFGVGLISCTAGLEIGLKAFGVGAGDEVIVPAFTFIATAFAPMYLGATPVMADIHPGSLCLDPDRTEEAITPRTRAISPVHYGGYPADMERFEEIARKHDLAIIVDAAHAHGAEWKGRKLGGMGDGSSFSLGGGKNMSTGEGGMLTTDNAELAERWLYTLSSFGRAKGEPGYVHYELGGHYPMNEFQAAILLGQLERFDEQTKKRNRNARYLNGLLAEIDGIEPPPLPPEVTQHGMHIYTFRIKPEEFGTDKRTFLDAAHAEGVPVSGGHPRPIYDNPMLDLETGEIAGGAGKFRVMECPESELLTREEGIAMGHVTLLAEESDMDDIAEGIAKVRRNVGQLQRVAV